MGEIILMGASYGFKQPVSTKTPQGPADLGGLPSGQMLLQAAIAQPLIWFSPA